MALSVPGEGEGGGSGTASQGLVTSPRPATKREVNVGPGLPGVARAAGGTEGRNIWALLWSLLLLASAAGDRDALGTVAQMSPSGPPAPGRAAGGAARH